MGVRQNINEARNDQYSEDLLRMPLRATVQNPLPERESVFVNMSLAANASEFTLRHPFFSVNSWIRAMPEVGATVTTQVRGDSPSNMMSGYLSEPGDVIPRIQNARKGREIFRILRAGEIEIMSSGRAYAHFSDGGDLELMGGTIRHDMLQSELETRSQAPTFKRQLHLHTPPVLAHEERFGVVKRPNANRPNAFQKFVRKSDNTFAQEYGRWLNKSDGTLLTSIHSGELYDASGKEKKQNSTNKPLRYETVTKHRSTGDLTFQIDEELNISYINSSKAKETKLVFGSKNTIDISAESLKGSFTKSGNTSFTTSFTLRAPKVRINAVDVGFGPNPVIPAVLGTPLTGAVLTPMLTGLTSMFTFMSVDPLMNLAFPQLSAVAKQSLAQLGAAAGALPSTLSTQVKLSG